MIMDFPPSSISPLEQGPLFLRSGLLDLLVRLLFASFVSLACFILLSLESGCSKNSHIKRRLGCYPPPTNERAAGPSAHNAYPSIPLPCTSANRLCPRQRASSIIIRYIIAIRSTTFTTTLQTLKRTTDQTPLWLTKFYLVEKGAHVA